jgi:hypothetical protein
VAVNTGINLIELGWAKTRVTWAWILVGALGGLSIGAYWLITQHPDVVAQLIFGFLIDPDKVSRSSDRTSLDLLQLFVYFVLSWIPLTGWGVHSLVSPPKTTLDVLAQAADLSPLLWQGLVYVALAVLIWRRSFLALILATLLFLADSGIYTYGVVRLFQALWDLQQHFADLVASSPTPIDNPYDLQHWPWGLVVPIVIRGAVLWFLLNSFGGMATVRLHHRRLKAARVEAEPWAA